MKKTILIAIIAIGLASCQKKNHYTCLFYGSQTDGSLAQKTVYGTGTKKDMKNAQKEGEAEFISYGFTQVWSQCDMN